jgi:hypothetical protein
MKTIRRVSMVLSAFAMLAAASGAAQADTRAWTEAKNVLPGGLQVLVGVNVANVRTSQIFQTMYPMILAQAGQGKEGLDLIKKDCGIDVLQTIDSLVVGMGSDEKGLIVIGLKGVDQSGVSSCFTKVAADKEPGKKITATQNGNVTEYSAAGENDKLYVQWLAKDVIAMGTEPTDSAFLKKMTAGGIKTDTLGKAAASINGDAGLWAVVNKSDTIPDLNAKMSMAYGSANFASGNIDFNLHVVIDSAAAAAKAATDASAKLDEQKKQSAQVASILKSVKVASSGPELVVTGSLVEKDVLALIGQFMPH